MSTAIEHGLAAPKRRGKPVSLANKGRRVHLASTVGKRGPIKVREGEAVVVVVFPPSSSRERGVSRRRSVWSPSLDLSSLLPLGRRVEQTDVASRPRKGSGGNVELGHAPDAASKGNPVNIPEPEGWTGSGWLRPSRSPSRYLGGVSLSREGRVSKGGEA